MAMVGVTRVYEQSKPEQQVGVASKSLWPDRLSQNGYGPKMLNDILNSGMSSMSEYHKYPEIVQPDCISGVL